MLKFARNSRFCHLRVFPLTVLSFFQVLELTILEETWCVRISFAALLLCSFLCVSLSRLAPQLLASAAMIADVFTPELFKFRSLKLPSCLCSLHAGYSAKLNSL